jgi:hypothetical protein
MTCPLRSAGITRFITNTRQSAPLRRIGTFDLAVVAARIFSLGIAGQVLTFRRRARLSVAPPTCRVSLGPSPASPKLIPEDGPPGFDINLSGFRQFTGGSLALASLNHTCRNLAPTFPQRSLPWPLTKAACGGLRSAPDCQTRRAPLHLTCS